MYKQRSYLSDTSIRLTGGKDNRPRTFRILKRNQTDHEGSAVICYRATFGSSGEGILKEFFPVYDETIQLIRDEDGQVMPPAGNVRAEQRFLEAMAEYIAPYRTILRLQTESENSDLRTFIADFEIFRGCGKDGQETGTFYIWEPKPKLVTFAEKCAEIHKNPDKRPEYNMMLILRAIHVLTDCVCALHRADLVHRDINPGNFGFPVRNNEILTDSITIFDINTLCSMDNIPTDKVAGSINYMEPEWADELANNRTDIYAIGTTLLYAIAPEAIGSDKEHLCERIPFILKDSALIQASETISHPKVLHKLTEILKRCLCPRQSRYRDCESLKADLEKALELACPSAFSGLIFKDPSAWKNLEKMLDQNQNVHTLRMLQYHLSENPLYRWSPEFSDRINIVIIGFGKYGRAFLDLCLQTGQIPGKKLTVDIISETLEDKEQYLQERSELTNFYSFDNSLPETAVSNSYGTIRFHEQTLSDADSDFLLNFLQESRQSDNSIPHYIFIATGSDLRNKNLAELLIFLQDRTQKYSVSYVCEQEKDDVPISGAFPVYVNTPSEKHPLYSVFERLAFNAHLLWKNQLNLDYSQVRREFKQKYYHDSCISLVLSIQYKLYSIKKVCTLVEDYCNTDFYKMDLADVAGKFTTSGFCQQNQYAETRNALICSEHARWVTEKLCQGWTVNTDLSSCMDGSTNNKLTRKHICLLPSESGQPLSYPREKKYQWDDMSEKDIEKLDHLDALSVRLHQMYMQKAQELRAQDLFGSSLLGDIRKMVQKEPDVYIAFQEWFTCLQAIWHRDQQKARLYDSLKKAFLDKAKAKMDKADWDVINKQTEAFSARFFPLIGCTRRRDFKDDDAILVDQIPFILTYSTDIHLIIPLVTGDNTALFNNVSAATLINPERITYLLHIDRKEEIDIFNEVLGVAGRYIDKKNLQAELELIITYNKNDDEISDQISWKNVCRDCLRIRYVQFIPVNSRSEISDVLQSVFLKKKRKKGRIILMEQNETPLSYLLDGSGFFQKLQEKPLFYGLYSFDAAGMEFKTMYKSDFLAYIPKSCHITTAEMTSFKRSGSFTSSTPEFFSDYTRLWDIYTSHSSAWKRLCEALQKHSDDNDKLVVIPNENANKKKPDATEYTYILPSYCEKAVNKIIEELKAMDIIEKESGIIGHTTESCKITIFDRFKHMEQFDKLFSNPYVFYEPEKIEIYLNTRQHVVNIRFNSLIVQNFLLGNINNMNDINMILEFLSRERYINNYRKQDDKISFTYCTHQVKQLLTSGGRILEIYTYHKCRELGVFDDVVSGYEVNWEETDVKSEFDCILTKGFRTLFVECKACSVLDQDYYYKLSCLAQKFGINATAVLVADTQEKEWYDHAPTNTMQRNRGLMLQIITVWQKDEIADIGNTLNAIIEGRYQQIV